MKNLTLCCDRVFVFVDTVALLDLLRDAARLVHQVARIDSPLEARAWDVREKLWGVGLVGGRVELTVPEAVVILRGLRGLFCVPGYSVTDTFDSLYDQFSLLVGDAE